MSFRILLGLIEQQPKDDDCRKNYNDEEYIRRLVSANSSSSNSNTISDRSDRNNPKRYNRYYDRIAEVGYVIWLFSIYYELVLRWLDDYGESYLEFSFTFFFTALSFLFLGFMFVSMKHSKDQKLQQKKECHVRDLVLALQTIVDSNYNDRDAARTAIVQLAYLGKKHQSMDSILINIYDPAEYAVAMLKHPHLGREIEEERKFRKKLRSLAIFLLMIPLALILIPLVTYCTKYGWLLFSIFVLPGIIYQLQMIRQQYKQMEDLVQDMYLIATGYAADNQITRDEEGGGVGSGDNNHGVEEMVPLYSRDPFSSSPSASASSPSKIQKQQQEQQPSEQPTEVESETEIITEKTPTQPEIQAECQALLTLD